MLKSLFYFIIFIIFHFTSFGQVYDFQMVNQEDGLPSSTINVIFQDSRDYIWIGTDGAGLVKYDGLNYEIFNKNNGLNSEFITDIIEDSNNNLVIATKYGG
ncbi:two-component regulator propeller domain-containing protein, partial [Flavobacterium sp.]|uniref:two-component regulator propeller domain-containing protein n=1 Tax=Flavobacterium sp. TaxID=239 RepID=UPI00374D0F84